MYIKLFLCKTKPLVGMGTVEVINELNCKLTVFFIFSGISCQRLVVQEKQVYISFPQISVKVSVMIIMLACTCAIVFSTIAFQRFDME